MISRRPEQAELQSAEQNADASQEERTLGVEAMKHGLEALKQMFKDSEETFERIIQRFCAIGGRLGQRPGAREAQEVLPGGRIRDVAGVEAAHPDGVLHRGSEGRGSWRVQLYKWI
jgi:hypothetical protein